MTLPLSSSIRSLAWDVPKPRSHAERQASTCVVPRASDESSRAAAVSRSVLSVMGTDIFYEDSSVGRPIVLLHGLNDSHRTWRAAAAVLAKSRRVLTDDRHASRVHSFYLRQLRTLSAP